MGWIHAWGDSLSTEAEATEVVRRLNHVGVRSAIAHPPISASDGWRVTIEAPEFRDGVLTLERQGFLTSDEATNLLKRWGDWPGVREVTR